MKSKTKNVFTMIIGLAVAVAFLLLVFIPRSQDKKQQPLVSETLSPEQVEINQQFAVLRRNGADNLSKNLKSETAKISDLPREVSSLLSGVNNIEVTEVKKVSQNFGSGFEVKFISRDSLLATHRNFGNVLIKQGWALVSGGRAAQASRLEFAKGTNPRMIIEIEMTQIGNLEQEISGTVLFISFK